MCSFIHRLHRFLPAYPALLQLLVHILSFNELALRLIIVIQLFLELSSLNDWQQKATGIVQTTYNYSWLGEILESGTSAFNWLIL